MKGHVPTPDALVDVMVARLFAERPPRANDRLLDPGCGDGAFIAGVLRWCRASGLRPPRTIGVELNPALASKARRRFADYPSVQIVNADYLVSPAATPFRYIIGNPPYVSLTRLGGEKQRDRYRARFATARGRFDLYMLFFERALEDLAGNGRLVFVTPEKFLYVATAERLRRLIATKAGVRAIDLAPEDVFPGFTTYPAITTLQSGEAVSSSTHVQLRDGTRRTVTLPTDGQSWWPWVQSGDSEPGTSRLADLCVRVSAGIATGADDIYVRDVGTVPTQLRAFAKPAMAGRDLTLGAPMPAPRRVILVPYADDGSLLPSERLGSLGKYLGSPANAAMLTRRTCTKRKPWYAFHDSYPVEILRPKIIFKDIAKTPQFWVDREGGVVPLHSVYYIIPERTDLLDSLCEWLNSEQSRRWLVANCQRAANGYIRLQSSVLRRMPLPESLLRQVA